MAKNNLFFFNATNEAMGTQFNQYLAANCKIMINSAKMDDKTVIGL